MQRKVRIVIIAAVVLVLAAGTIAAQSILGGENYAQREAKPETLTGEGLLVGRIDSHAVEIEIDGEPRAFGLSADLRDEEFAAGPVSFKYYIDQDGRFVLVGLSAAPADETAVKTAEGVFNGLADSHTVEIRIGGEDRSFTFVEGIEFDDLRPGDRITIHYKEDETGRQVIVRPGY